ncbi:hypothetical protein DUI87_13657 [Hirundo rustica rustica]|uniref:RRM domain-containing protein n=1 Tax=Hirundo rustica rustica TaxID=333673 RepID=A0A3M0KFK2_HIRRU|nr:hypothetical protein DUI87_13657 [Hirundo rustica rustica]
MEKGQLAAERETPLSARVWQDIAIQVTMKVCHVDAHAHKSQANEEHRNNEQVDQAAKIKVSQLGVSLGTLGAIPAAALDPNITTLGELPQPPVMGNVDPSKIDEIRRTVYIGNLNSQQVGEVKFVRMAGDETQPTRFAFVEFADQNSVPRALAFNGVMFGDRPLKINHSNNAIVKPPEMTPQAAAKELEEVMKRVREAQSFISAAIEPDWFPNSC